MKIKNLPQNTLAKITAWPGTSLPGSYVVKIDGNLYSLSRLISGSGPSWSEKFLNDSMFNKCEVEPVKKGETITYKV